MKISFFCLIGLSLTVSGCSASDSSVESLLDHSGAANLEDDNGKPGRKLRSSKKSSGSKRTSKRTSNGIAQAFDQDMILALRNIHDPYGEIAPNSNQEFDFDGDGQVTIADIAQIIDNYLSLASVEELFPSRGNRLLLDKDDSVTEEAGSSRDLLGCEGVENYNGYARGPLSPGGPAGRRDMSKLQFVYDEESKPNPVDYLSYITALEVAGLTDTSVSTANAAAARAQGWRDTAQRLRQVPAWYMEDIPEMTDGIAEMMDGLASFFEQSNAVEAEIVSRYIGRDEALQAFRHYLQGTGDTISVDYEKAIREDSKIRSAFETERRAALDAARALRGDETETSFEFHRVSVGSTGSGTVNWLGALGKHNFWSSGTVTYNKGTCTLDVSLEVSVEDIYDFDFDYDPFKVEWIGYDIIVDFNAPTKTQMASLMFGRFVKFGWAKPFYTRTAVSRSESIELACCSDSDCPLNQQCKCNICEAKCPTTYTSGGQGLNQAYTIDLKSTTGTFNVNWDMIEIPDQLDVYYEGQNIFSTQGLVKGIGSAAIQFGSPTSTSTVVTAVMNAPQDLTRWHLSVECPA